MNFPKSKKSPVSSKLKKKFPIPVMREQLRRDYKVRVRNCRDIIINKFRECASETELRMTLSAIYKNMFNFSDFDDVDEEETDLLEKIKHELIDEEIQRWQEEYEKSQMNDLDLSTLEEENIICPICQKTNFKYEHGIVLCPFCNIKIKTEKPLIQIKKIILESIEKHSANCNTEAKFTSVTEINDTHIYLFCANCTDLQLLI